MGRKLAGWMNDERLFAFLSLQANVRGAYKN